VLYLRRDDVRRLLPDVAAQRDLARATFLALARGAVEMPAKVAIHPRPDGFSHAMPAYLRDEDVAVVKWVSAYARNRRSGIPSVSALIIVNDPDTGRPIVVMDGTEITLARTVATTCVCIDRFAPAGWRRATILGCGPQGVAHGEMIRALHPDAEIRGWDRHPERAAAVSHPAGETADDPAGAVQGAELVITALAMDQHGGRPQLRLTGERDGVAGRLIVAIDFDASVTAADVAKAGRLVSDDVAQFEAFRDAGYFDGWPPPGPGLGDALSEPRDPVSSVVCCNLGVAALDAAFAQAVVSKARVEGVGTTLPD
jgi:ornithine cyclodeaminase/alanine dehydrogenase-like protein (mu-crystallin family)